MRTVVWRDGCGACYQRVWVCNLDKEEADYTRLFQTEANFLEPDDLRVSMLRRGLRHLHDGVIAFHSHGTLLMPDAELKRRRGSQVGVIQWDRTKGRKATGIQSRQIVNLKELVEACDLQVCLWCNIDVVPYVHLFHASGATSVVLHRLVTGGHLREAAYGCDAADDRSEEHTV